MPGSVRVVPSADLATGDVAAIRALLREAFADDGEGFSDADWDHAVGGVHGIAELDGRIVAHGSVVPRSLELDGLPVRAGYVEAVATAPGRQGEGHGSAVMRVIDELIRGDYELGALGTGAHRFYERLGWRRWRGRTGVRTADGVVLTPDDDDGIMVLPTTSTPAIDLRGLLTCEWREGDVW